MKHETIVLCRANQSNVGILEIHAHKPYGQQDYFEPADQALIDSQDEVILHPPLAASLFESGELPNKRTAIQMRDPQYELSSAKSRWIVAVSSGVHCAAGAALHGGICVAPDIFVIHVGGWRFLPDPGASSCVHGVSFVKSENVGILLSAMETRPSSIRRLS